MNGQGMNGGTGGGGMNTTTIPINSSNINKNNSNNNSANGGPRSKCDQIIVEALCKSFEIIVSNRSNTITATSNSNTPTTNYVSSGNNVFSNAFKNNNSNNSSFATTAGIAGTANGINSSSTRFNLQVSEVPGIREIIMYQRQLQCNNNSIDNIPFRLDVYYQHPNDTGRELLERWCFENTTTTTTTTTTSGVVSSSSKSTGTNTGNGTSMEKFLAAEGLLTTQKHDPIIQLRHVWKRIVLWLRTLYVYTGFLPSHVFHRLYNTNNNNNNNNDINRNPIGFSLYVSTDGVDDINQLTQQQGFLCSRLPSGTVTTPYGQLSCTVLYLPTSSIQHLLPQQQANNTTSTSYTNPVYSNPIIRVPNVPYMQQNHQQQHQQQQQQQPNALHHQQHYPQSQPIPMSYDDRRNCTEHHLANSGNFNATEMMQYGSTDKINYQRQMSAPVSPVVDPRNYQRASSYSERSLQLQHVQQQQQLQQQQQQQQNHQQQFQPQQQQQQQQHYAPNSYNPKRQGGMMTFDPSKLIPPRKPSTEFNQQQQQHSPALKSINTTTQQQRHIVPSIPAADGKGPERVMSGLSLALMMADGSSSGAVGTDNQQQPPNIITTNTVDGGEYDMTTTSINAKDETTYEYNSDTRRAALHEMPPHVVEHQQSFGAIPPSPRQHHYYHHSASSFRSNSFDMPLASTPPTAAFVGGTPIQRPRILLSGQQSSAATTPSSSIPNSSSLPSQTRRRSSSSSNSIGKGTSDAVSLANGCITPPFRERPLGFLHEATVEEGNGGSSFLQSDAELNVARKDSNINDGGINIALHQQLASLDLLHNSPFQLQHYEQSSLLPSLTAFTGYTAGGNPANGGGLDSVLSHYSNPVAGVGWAGTSGLLFSHHHSPRSAAVGTTTDDDSCFFEDTMPFAVDLSSSTSLHPFPTSSTILNSNNNQMSNNTNSHTVSTSIQPNGIDASFFGGQSAALASLVQKCGPNSHRLKLFESTTSVVGTECTSTDGAVYNHSISNDTTCPSTSGFMSTMLTTQNEQELMSDLADQLEDFRAFGASIHM